MKPKLRPAASLLEGEFVFDLINNLFTRLIPAPDHERFPSLASRLLPPVVLGGNAFKRGPDRPKLKKKGIKKWNYHFWEASRVHVGASSVCADVYAIWSDIPSCAAVLQSAALSWYALICRVQLQFAGFSSNASLILRLTWFLQQTACLPFPLISVHPSSFYDSCSQRYPPGVGLSCNMNEACAKREGRPPCHTVHVHYYVQETFCTLGKVNCHLYLNKLQQQHVFNVLQFSVFQKACQCCTSCAWSSPRQGGNWFLLQILFNALSTQACTTLPLIYL